MELLSGNLSVGFFLVSVDSITEIESGTVYVLVSIIISLNYTIHKKSFKGENCKIHNSLKKTFVVNVCQSLASIKLNILFVSFLFGFQILQQDQEKNCGKTFVVA